MIAKRYGPVRLALLSALLQTLPGKLASHWLVQGMAYMDPTERRFKLALDAAGVALLTPALATRLPRLSAALSALFLVHSANFLLNGHLRGALKWHGLGGVPQDALEAELVGISRRLAACAAINQAYLYGSVSRAEHHDGSDLDIRVLRNPGLRAGLAACWVVLLERARSLASGVPIDIYVWDSWARFDDMRPDEVPVDLRTLAFERLGRCGNECC